MRKEAITEILWAAAGVILAAILMGSGNGCSKPVLEGGQISKVPEGFFFDANAEAARLVFPDRAKLDQRGYFAMRDDEHCSIMITEYEGTTEHEAVTTARDRAAEKYSYQDCSEVEPLHIDGQPAWGWLVTQRVKGEISSYKYTAVVSYEDDNLTYTVEFYASDPRYRDPEFQKETVQGFEVQKAGVSYGYVGLAVVLAAGFGAAFRAIRRSA
jgi:hypothetical protein